MNGVKLIALSMRPSMIYSTAGVTDISKVFLPKALIQARSRERRITDTQ